VPPVRERCNRLGLRGSTSIEISAFISATHAFRKSYKASDGRHGIDLTDWDNVKVRQELRAMAVKFVESGNGEQFLSRPTSSMGDKTR
jgi:hypothetical protein